MRRSFVVAAGVTVALAFLMAGFGAGRLLVVADPLPPSADAIVILAGSIPDRALEAYDLYRARIAPRILVTREPLWRGEVALRARGIRLAETDGQTVDVLAQLGVPRAAIRILRRRNTSTNSEARTIARDACAHGYRRLVVVTSRQHTRRARLILRRALGPGVELVMRPAHYDEFRGARWWRVRRNAKLVLGEYERLVNFWLRERWSIRPCGGLARRAPVR